MKNKTANSIPPLPPLPPFHSLLCLGDSYTIGEGVAIQESFPYLLVQMLRKKGTMVSAPEIVAKTGWTTSELRDAIKDLILPEKFDVVTMLIGVNNQYREESIEKYGEEFEELLKTAIGFSKDGEAGMIVLSIPDWGVTPFAEGRNREQIAKEIDSFNELNRSITQKYKCKYIDITPGTRKAEENLDLIAPDKLHYSGIEHRRWADLVANEIV